MRLDSQFTDVHVLNGETSGAGRSFKKGKERFDGEERTREGKRERERAPRAHTARRSRVGSPSGRVDDRVTHPDQMADIIPYDPTFSSLCRSRKARCPRDEVSKLGTYDERPDGAVDFRAVGSFEETIWTMGEAIAAPGSSLDRASEHLPHLFWTDHGPPFADRGKREMSVFDDRAMTRTGNVRSQRVRLDVVHNN